MRSRPQTRLRPAQLARGVAKVLSSFPSSLVLASPEIHPAPENPETNLQPRVVQHNADRLASGDEVKHVLVRQTHRRGTLARATVRRWTSTNASRTTRRPSP